jgi:hypothetical protein
MKKRDYWNRRALFDTGAQYLIVYGQNCSGKSYQAKLEAIERALKGERFFHLRRYSNDLNQNTATLYFDDMNVEKLTGGKWENIEAWQGFYYFTRIDENGHKEKSDQIGAYGALSTWQKLKSIAWVNYTYIIYEEFIATVYLDEEPLLLQRAVTALFRDHAGTVLMIGNTISRTNPFFMEWTPGVLKQKQGTIEIYHYFDEANENIEVTIAVEYGGKIKGSGSMFFGEASKSILAGEWSVTNQPKLPKDKIDYEEVYELALEYQSFAFVLQLLIDPDEGTKLLYVYPRTTKRKIERVITDKFSDNIMVTRYFKDNRPESYIMDCINNNRVCYSDNLTASDFLGVVEAMGI